MLIREAVEHDLPAIRSLAERAATAAQWSERTYAELFTSSAPRLILLDVLQTEVIGFVVVRTAAQEWEVENIAVSPLMQRKGVGLRLIGEVINRLPPGTDLLLEVRASNAAARALYAHAGFKESGRRAAYYQNPAEDAILYRFVNPAAAPESG